MSRKSRFAVGPRAYAAVLRAERAAIELFVAAAARGSVTTEPIDRRFTETAERIRVVVVDDHDIFRSGLRHLLDARGFEVVGEADNGETAVDLVTELCPDVVLMDIHMPRMSGVDAIERIAALAPLVRVLVLTISADQADVADALVAGASGYLLKDASVDDLAAGIRAAHAGESLISPPVAAQLIKRVRDGGLGNGRTAHALERELSERELEVLKLVAQGKDNAEMARELFLSPKTVKNHISSILRKLQMESRIEAALYAVKSGIV